MIEAVRTSDGVVFGGLVRDPALLGLHLEQGGGLAFEVIGRRLEDRGGRLARVNERDQAQLDGWLRDGSAAYVEGWGSGLEPGQTLR